MNRMTKKLVMGISASALVLLGSVTGVANAQGGTIHKHAWEAHPPIHIKNDATSSYVNGLSPAQLRHAYGLDLLSKTGAGQTIAIVDAYGSPTIAEDLAAFSNQFGLPAADLTVVFPDGEPHKSDPGWALETAMDVEWAHAIAPEAKILLVAAKSASIADLLSGIDYATTHGAQVVSNSWGGSEFSGEGSYNSHFQHEGVAYLASSGDSGAGSSWPASSPFMIAVGGTTLSVDETGNYLGETAWSGSGGALSTYETRPVFQDRWVDIVGSSRGIPDVSFDADPNTGVAVLSTTRLQGQQGWFQVGGTSLGAPAWAAMIALADEGRTTALSSVDALSALYNLAGTTGSAGYSTNFYDILQGDNGGFSAQPGYDLVTGIGSPVANQVLPALTQAQ